METVCAAMKSIYIEFQEVTNMDELLEALKRVNPNIDYAGQTGLYTNKIIDSIDMTSILADLEDTFDIEIGMEYIIPENFDSVEAMWAMVQELMD